MDDKLEAGYAGKRLKQGKCYEIRQVLTKLSPAQSHTFELWIRLTTLVIVWKINITQYCSMVRYHLKKLNKAVIKEKLDGSGGEKPVPRQQQQ